MDATSAWSERCRQLAEPIVAACEAVPVASGPAVMARELAQGLPDWSFRETLCRGGWYRLGGVVDGQGVRLSDNLEAWAEAALEERDGDIAMLCEELQDSALRATVFSGRTHYFAASAPGGGASDFLQLEIEDLQEVVSHRLFERAQVPATLDELIDCRCGAPGQCGDADCGAPLGRARYRFRRLVHVGDVLARMRTQALDAQPIHRFVADWEASSAGVGTVFCNHWTIALREHLDRFRQTITRATPVAALNGEAPRFAAKEGTGGLSLHAALTAFDRAAGYPMAWFFSLLVGKAVPHWVPAAVASDTAAGFSYLPERDLAVLKAWLHRPYVF